MDDVFEDIWQGLGNDWVQYKKAMEIADHLANRPRLVDAFITTGHSLGGGLASAATCVSAAPGITFNAAGLHLNTLYMRDANDNLVLDPNGNPIEMYPGSIAIFNNPTALIDAYYVDYDLLSAIQDNTPLPNAIGNRIPMDSQHDLDMALAAASIFFAFYSGSPWSSLAGAVSGFATMAECHRTPQIFYGLLVQEDAWGYIIKDTWGYYE